jgi:hypothetical protein
MSQKPPPPSHPPRPSRAFDESFFAYHPHGGYHPVSCEWWAWDPAWQMFVPIEHDGWAYNFETAEWEQDERA